MTNGFSLLNVNMEILKDFHLQAQLVDNAENRRIIDKAITRLNNVEQEALQGGDAIEVSTQTIQKVVLKAKKCVKGESDDKLSARELRILAYNLYAIQDIPGCFSYVLRVIASEWRNLFLNGLVYSVMSCWDILEHENRTAACDLIRNKLGEYVDENRRFLTLKNHAYIFDEAGPLRVSALTKSKYAAVEDAPALIGFRPRTFEHSYYDDVIIEYYKQEDYPDLERIEATLAAHPSDKAKKMVISNLILAENGYNDVLRQAKVCSLARRILGDLMVMRTWSPFIGATLEEEDRMRQAKELVNMWYTRNVIETFFDKCVQDPNRKRYWLKYITYIDNFKIAGSVSVKRSLMLDARVAELLNRIFIETNSRTCATAVLVLSIRDKVFVEFSDLGSLYVYRPNHRAVKNIINKRYLDSINDLKDTSIGKLVEQGYYDWDYEYNEVGAMRHAGQWQDRLDRWMTKMILPLPANTKSLPDVPKAHS